MSKNIRSVLLLFLSGCMLLFSWSCKTTVENTEEETVARTPVTIGPVEYKTVTSGVDLPAVTSFLNKSLIRSTTAGSITKMMVHQGDPVVPGQVLFTIRTREAMAFRRSATADSDLTFKGLINISANTSGIISTVSFQEGDFVQEGDELASMDDPGSLIFILDVPFGLNRYVSRNRNCKIQLPDSTIIQGTITGKLAEMDMQSQTVRYIVKPSAAKKLPANLIGSIRLIKDKIENAAVLPKDAVLGNETQTEFWVMKLLNDTMAVRVNVRKGYEDNNEVQITEPVFLPSDRIILTGNYGLPDTARIFIKEE